MTSTARRILVAVVIAVHLGLDLLWPWFADGPPNFRQVWAVGAGCCIGQVTLVAVWLALAPGPFVVRLPWAVLLTVLMWLVLVLGFQLRQGSRMVEEEAATLGSALLFGVLLTQFPLGGIALWLRLRLAPVEESRPDGLQDRQYRISHLLWGILLLSLALGIARLILPQRAFPDLFDHELPVLLSAVAITNFLVTVPCIWGAFAPWRWMPPLAVGWLVYAVAMSFLEVAVLVAFLGSPGQEPVPISVIFSAINLAQCTAVWMTLVVLRLAGFRLVRRA